MEKGYVYVLVNSSIPGMAKVGRTARAPGARAAELSGVTGVATPFIVAYEQAFEDCHAAERAIHAELDRRGLRVAPNREFFRGAPSDIIRLILDTGEAPCVAGCDAAAVAAETGAALMQAGDRALYGLGDALQDTGEAVRCYRLAATRGALPALERLGGIYLRLYAEAPTRAARRRAMTPLKEGARRGNAYCYVEMAALFGLDGHADNVAKAWKLFFAAAGEEPAEPARHAAACGRYIRQCLQMGVAPLHQSALRQAGGGLLGVLLAEVDASRASDATTRLQAVAALRWAYAHVLVERTGAPSDAVRAKRPWWLAVRPAAA